ncbi:hypothetical protein OPV22_026514 [Ensete ventricosum]|uniref:Uncharacterized protein n=1 Tax=Ensete ventricosum TaxID=4639 RepID=A0AAV8P8K2_ENSVE|nr:hypothetical protein OPV22_026514 [Ensete ventricosum]
MMTRTRTLAATPGQALPPVLRRTIDAASHRLCARDRSIGSIVNSSPLLAFVDNPSSESDSSRCSCDSFLKVGCKIRLTDQDYINE